jgi:Fe-S oxidoreductase
MSPNPLIFAALLLASLGIFCAGCYRRLKLVSLGRSEGRTDNSGLRLKQLLLHAIAQKRVVTKPFGLNHAVIFWSFLLLLLANGEFLLKGLFPAVSLALLPAAIHHGLLLAFDLVSLLTLAAVLLAIARRLFFPPAAMSSAYVKARSPEGFLILACIALLMLAYFGLHGAEIALGQEETAAWMPVSALVARFIATSPLALSPEPLALFCWWLHAVALLAFLCFLPQSKHMHILTSLPNIFCASLTPVNTQPREEFARGKNYGVASVEQFTWKDLLDGFACTECGRCQEACPAAATGKPLNPRQLIHAIKTNLLANGPRLREGKTGQLPLVGPEDEGSTTADAIWACTTCGACLHACPVLIEHMPKLVKLRRHLVQMEARFPAELLTLFENMEGRSNPWGIAPTERTKWSATMAVKPFAAEKTEYLFYIGCAGAFDSRQKQATVAMATILDAAGVSWGILGKEELCCGDSVRRLGNEYLFDTMARQNIRLFTEKGVTKIITQCPHCFSVLKNDYRQYGLELDVIHHTELIQQLLSSGRLTLNRQVNDLGKMLFHDSCYLGRHNDILEEPRQAIRLATGSAPQEFRRSGTESFCCGAGGGRMWQEELHGERINLNRVKEALEQQPDTICVSCPYCMTMMEDGLKDLQAGAVKVRDLAEVVAEGLRPAASQAT